MTVAYCSVADIKQLLAGDVPTLSSQFDGTIAAAIRRMSSRIDSHVRRSRAMGQPWSFVAQGSFAVQQIILSTGQLPPTAGTFTLSFGGSTTTALAYNASAATIQAALQALASVGVGNMTVSGPVYGPFTVTFAGALSGPQATVTGDGSSLTPAGAAVTVWSTVDAYSPVPSTRTYDGSAGGVDLLPIDDCISVASVGLYLPAGTLSQALLPTTDYVTWPYNGPIRGLRLVSLPAWPENVAGVQVSATWNPYSSVPDDIRDVAIVETTRKVVGGRSGQEGKGSSSQWGAAGSDMAFLPASLATLGAYRLFGAGSA